ncbi:MAG: hypothetical protein ACJ73Z_03320 [Rubrobacteraceae bacterium]
MHPDKTVSQKVEEVLDRQAKVLADGTSETLQRAMAAALKTDAVQRLKELAESPNGEQGAAEWQAGLSRARAEERHYSWLEGYIEWLEGKEERTQYHALLEEELASLRG